MAATLVVIPVLNEAAALPTLLDQLLADTQDETIVVADGGSTDGSRAIVEELAARHCRLHLLDNPARIQSAGINLAVRRFGAGRRWLVRVDAHCDYPRDYCRRLVAVAEERQAISVVVPMASHGVGCFQQAAAAAQNSPLGTGGSPHRHVADGGRLVDHGHHALMTIDLFQQVGGYREDMPTNEDAELDLRLIAAGGRIWLEPALALVYYPRGTARSLWTQYWRYGRGRARTLALHGRRPKPRQAIPLLVPAAGAVALAAPLSPVLLVPLLAWMALCLVAGVAVGRRSGRCAMMCGVPAMVMHMAWGLGFLREQIARR